jgi:hypothetical protein
VDIFSRAASIQQLKELHIKLPDDGWAWMDLVSKFPHLRILRITCPPRAQPAKQSFNKLVRNHAAQLQALSLPAGLLVPMIENEEDPLLPQLQELQNLKITHVKNFDRYRIQPIFDKIPTSCSLHLSYWHLSELPNWPRSTEDLNVHLAHVFSPQLQLDRIWVNGKPLVSIYLDRAPTQEDVISFAELDLMIMLYEIETRLVTENVLKHFLKIVTVSRSLSVAGYDSEPARLLFAKEFGRIADSFGYYDEDELSRNLFCIELVQYVGAQAAPVDLGAIMRTPPIVDIPNLLAHLESFDLELFCGICLSALSDQGRRVAAEADAYLRSLDHVRLVNLPDVVLKAWIECDTPNSTIRARFVDSRGRLRRFDTWRSLQSFLRLKYQRRQPRKVVTPFFATTLLVGQPPERWPLLTDPIPSPATDFDLMDGLAWYFPDSEKLLTKKAINLYYQTIVDLDHPTVPQIQHALRPWVMLYQAHQKNGTLAVGMSDEDLTRLFCRVISRNQANGKTFIFSTLVEAMKLFFPFAYELRSIEESDDPTFLSWFPLTDPGSCCICIGLVLPQSFKSGRCRWG